MSDATCIRCGYESVLDVDGIRICLSCVPAEIRALRATAQSKSESDGRERVAKAKSIGELAKAKERIAELEAMLDGILVGIDDMPFGPEGQCVGCEGVYYHESNCAYVRAVEHMAQKGKR